MLAIQGMLKMTCSLRNLLFLVAFLDVTSKGMQLMHHLMRSVIATASFNAEGDTAESTNGKLTAHQKRKLQAAKAWESSRASIFWCAVEYSTLPKVFCQHCNKVNSSVCCKQCGPRVYYCVECAVKLHTTMYMLHSPQLWKVHQYWVAVKLHLYSCYIKNNSIAECVHSHLGWPSHVCSFATTQNALSSLSFLWYTVWEERNLCGCIW